MMKFKNKAEYLELRNKMLNEANSLMQAGKKDDFEAKTAEIESLDNDWETFRIEAANKKSMEDKFSALNLENAGKAAEGMVIEDMKKAENVLSNENIYKNAYLKKLQGIELDDVEMRAYTSAGASGGAAIPAPLAEEIITKVKQLAPMLSEITLLQVSGNISFAVEGARAGAAIHTENAAISAEADTLIKVTLSSYEITKLIQVSKTVSTMSINAFETWIVDILAEDIARKIENQIINGTGSDMATGIEKANTWGATNSVTVAKAASTTAANVQALIGLLPGGYDRNAKFVMKKSTLFTEFLPLQDNSKSNIVTREGNQYFVYGYPVLLSDEVTDKEAYFGDFKKMVGNLSEDITIESGFDINTNSFKYLGCAMFDCKPALGEAFVKLVKATA